MHNNLVNLSKMQKIAKILQMVKDGQTSPFCLTPVPIIQQYIRNLKYISESEYAEHRDLCRNSAPQLSEGLRTSKSTNSLHVATGVRKLCKLFGVSNFAKISI